MTMERRLIDANALNTSIALYMAENAYLNDTPLDILKMVSRWIAEAATIDAVEVVRCAQCVSYRHAPVKHCTLIGMQKEDDDYCSYGERREPDGNKTNNFP